MKINPPFRADHVGSLLRPKRLLEAREKAGLAGDGAHAQSALLAMETDELNRTENECIREAVAFQESVGLNSITDGEFRRASWAYDLARRIDGLTLRRQEGPFTFSGAGSRPPVFYTEGKLKRKPGGIALNDFNFTKSLTKRTVKVTMPSPTLLFVRGARAGVSEEAYPELDPFFEDVGSVYREEIADLAAAGCTYVQIDNTDAAYICDPKFQETARKLGWEPEEQIGIQARMVSAATRNRPAGVTVAMHVCRGNSAGNWMAEGGYEFVADALFNKFDVDAYFLEYDDLRSGDFAPLRFCPKTKTVVLGLVTTKRPENDTKDQLKRRIDDAAKYLPLENLCLSPQCGFASVAKGNPITLDDQRRKLALIVEVAQEVWGSA